MASVINKDDKRHPNNILVSVDVSDVKTEEKPAEKQTKVPERKTKTE